MKQRTLFFLIMCGLFWTGSQGLCHEMGSDGPLITVSSVSSVRVGVQPYEPAPTAQGEYLYVGSSLAGVSGVTHSIRIVVKRLPDGSSMDSVDGNKYRFGSEVLKDCYQKALLAQGNPHRSLKVQVRIAGSMDQVGEGVTDKVIYLLDNLKCYVSQE